MDKKIEFKHEWLCPIYTVFSSFSEHGRQYDFEGENLIGDGGADSGIETIDMLAKEIYHSIMQQRNIVCDIDPTKKWDDIGYTIKQLEEPPALNYNIDNPLQFTAAGPLTGQEWFGLYKALYARERHTQLMFKQNYNEPGYLQ